MPMETQVQGLVEAYLGGCADLQEVKAASDESKIKTLDEQAAAVNLYRGRPLFFKYVGSGRGRGPYVELEDGSVKIDLINGIGIHVLGHSHPYILESSVKAALSDVVMQGNLQPNKEYMEIMEKLVEIGSRSSNLKHVWLCPSGSMANENGLKMCRQKTNGARMVIAMENSFAGRTTMMAEVTDNDNYRVGLPRYNEVLRIPFYDSKDPQSSEKSLEAFKAHVEKHRGDISCFMFEPMQGEGGYKVAPKEFFLPILEICKKEGIPVFLDEVQTFCRTGEFFAFETLGLGDYVDVVSVAKTLQTGATFYTEEFNPKPGLISGTFSGSTVALAAGKTVLETLDDGYMGDGGKIQRIHKGFTDMLKDLNKTTCKGLVNDVEGLGLMVAFTAFNGEKDKMLAFVKRLFENGVMCFGCGSGPFRVRFLLPAVLEDKHINEIKKIMEKTLLELK
ncbi:MAG: aminotransferase class III-fold pyridoxal phosphate-dependent enzyme [Bdellovibrionales bacterium]